MVKDSAWTWAYFFAAPDKASVAQLFGDRKKTLSFYKVEKVVAIRGKPGLDVKPGSTIVRVETAAKLPAAAEAKMPSLLLQGVPQHLQYTTKEQRDDLAKRSRAELPPSRDTVAVIIPIRKSAAWWALPHDERQAHFQKKGDKIGHTAIGAKYAERIYRKLYHTRYAVETTDHDFITYFEFERSHTDDFKSLVHQLRDPEQQRCADRRRLRPWPASRHCGIDTNWVGAPGQCDDGNLCSIPGHSANQLLYLSPGQWVGYARRRRAQPYLRRSSAVEYHIVARQAPGCLGLEVSGE